MPTPLKLASYARTCSKELLPWAGKPCSQMLERTDVHTTILLEIVQLSSRCICIQFELATIAGLFLLWPGDKATHGKEALYLRIILHKRAWWQHHDVIMHSWLHEQDTLDDMYISYMLQLMVLTVCINCPSICRPDCSIHPCSLGPRPNQPQHGSDTRAG